MENIYVKFDMEMLKLMPYKEDCGRTQEMHHNTLIA